MEAWRCHIGLGYNRIVAEHDRIASEILYFCPMPDAESSCGDDVGDPCLIWRVKLANKSHRKRTISATNYVEPAPGNWFEDTSWREFYLLFNRQEFKDQVLYTRSMNSGRLRKRKHDLGEREWLLQTTRRKLKNRISNPWN